MAFKRVVNKRASVWHLCDGAAWKPGFHLTLLAKSANWKLQNMITHAPCCLLTRNVMIISVQTPFHYEYILYLNAHFNGFMVNSQLHVTICPWVWHCLLKTATALSWDDFLRVVCVTWTLGIVITAAIQSGGTVKWKSFGLTLQLGLIQPTSIFKWYDYIIMLSMGS